MMKRWPSHVSHDGTVSLWDVANQQPLGDPLKAHKGAAYAVVFTSDDGRTLASAGQDTPVMLWNLAQPDRPPVALPGHTDRVRGLAFSPHGDTLASASGDKAMSPAPGARRAEVQINLCPAGGGLPALVKLLTDRVPRLTALEFCHQGAAADPA